MRNSDLATISLDCMSADYCTIATSRLAAKRNKQFRNSAKLITLPHLAFMLATVPRRAWDF